VPGRTGGAHISRAAGLEPSSHCGPLLGFLWPSTTQQSRSYTQSCFWGATTPQDKHPQSKQAASAKQIPGVWETHPAPLGCRSTGRLRQEGTSAVPAPASNFIVDQIAQGLVCISFEYLQGWISQQLSGSLRPYPKVAALSLGKCFTLSSWSFPSCSLCPSSLVLSRAPLGRIWTIHLHRLIRA